PTVLQPASSPSNACLTANRAASMRSCTSRSISTVDFMSRSLTGGLPLDQEPPRPRTRFTTRRPSTVRGVSQTALMTFAPPDTVPLGDGHRPAGSVQHGSANGELVACLPPSVHQRLSYSAQRFLRGVTVERFRHQFRSF